MKCPTCDGDHVLALCTAPVSLLRRELIRRFDEAIARGEILPREAVDLLFTLASMIVLAHNAPETTTAGRSILVHYFGRRAARVLEATAKSAERVAARMADT